MLIDGGNASDAPSIIKFLESKGVNTLDVVVATHGHEDHIGGLGTIIDHFKVGTVYCSVDTYPSVTFSEFLDAVNRQCELTLCTRGMSWKLGSAEISVLWPDAPDKENPNNTSIVLNMAYGKTSFLFTGDVEKDAETQFSDEKLKCDVLKVAHHGSVTSTSYRFLREAQPKYAVISAGANNIYGHPHKETLSILEQADIEVLRTDLMGTVEIVSDGESIYVVNDLTITPEATASLTHYIGNAKTKKFHSPHCANLPIAKNSVSFKTYKEATDNGYSPCKNCNPT
jgi:competence protein ComEC